MRVIKDKNIYNSKILIPVFRVYFRQGRAKRAKKKVRQYYLFMAKKSKFVKYITMCSMLTSRKIR